jgi:serine phosphatase RsbU (regulator of sigma subunit)
MTRYSNLPPGEYEFIVQVKYAGGRWIESPESRFSFTIKPPFWKTTWFIIAAILLVLIGIYAFIQLRVRKLRRDRDRLEEEVRKRTAEIQRQKEEIETQRDEIEAQRDNVVQQRNQIEKQNKEITSSIHYASRIQNAVLPPEPFLGKFLGEHFILFKPRDIVSGDFYYVNTKYDKVIVAAADCTGHGVPGAFMSMLGTSLLNHILSQMENDFTAGEILTKLRDEVKNALRQSQDDSNQAKDGMDISLVVFRRGDRTIHYAGAYNPLTIVRNKEIIRHKGDPMPIGIHIKEKEHFTDHEIEVQKDDMLYLYSDGYQDQFGGERRKKFLPKNLRAKLVEISDKPVTTQKEMLNQSFLDWKGDTPQVDDVLVIGFRI